MIRPEFHGVPSTSAAAPLARRVVALAAILAGTFTGSPLRAQQPAAATPPDPRRLAADSLLQQAYERVEAGDTSAAIKLLDRAMKVDPKYAVLYYQKGRLLEETSQLGMSDILRRRSASSNLNRAIDLDGRNPYYLLELGRIRLKTPFLRLDAERLFNRALRAAQSSGDPRVLAQVEWELGQIHERRYNTMANRRMITGSQALFDPNEALDTWHYTADFFALHSQPVPDAGELDFRKAEEHYRAAVNAFPSYEPAAVGLLSLLYEAGRLEEMANLSAQLLASQPQSAKLHLALGLALHRMDRDIQAEPVFDTAVALLTPDDRRDMVSLENLLRKDDARGYAHLTDVARARMDSLYWDLADPLRLTTVNEARVEFYARVAYTELRFSNPETGVHGWRTDRGMVYLRYGPPPMIGTFAPETQEIDAADNMAKVTTVWWYPQSRLRFVFVGPPAMNYARFASDFGAYTENTRAIVPASFDNVSRSMKVDSVPVQVARFRPDTGRGVDVSIYADIPTAHMLREVDLSQATVETGLFVTDPSRRTVASARDSALVRVNERDTLTQRAWRRILPEGTYLYRVEARESASGRSARGLAPFELTAFAPGQYALSDLLVARRIAPRVPGAPVRNRADFFIVPNGSLRYAKRDTVFLYWELYGAAKDSTGSAHFAVDLTLRLSEVDRGKQVTARILGGVIDAIGLSAKGDDRVALHFERRVALDSGDRVPNYLALDLGDAPYGTYTMELTVRDLVSGRSATRERTITVPRP